MTKAFKEPDIRSLDCYLVFWLFWVQIGYKLLCWVTLMLTRRGKKINPEGVQGLGWHCCSTSPNTKWAQVTLRALGGQPNGCSSGWALVPQILSEGLTGWPFQSLCYNLCCLLGIYTEPERPEGNFGDISDIQVTYIPHLHAYLPHIWTPESQFCVPLVSAPQQEPTGFCL